MASILLMCRVHIPTRANFPTGHSGVLQSTDGLYIHLPELAMAQHMARAQASLPVDNPAPWIVGWSLPCELRDHLDDLIFARTSLGHCFTHLADIAERIVAAFDTP